MSVTEGSDYEKTMYSHYCGDCFAFILHRRILQTAASLGDYRVRCLLNIIGYRVIRADAFCLIFLDIYKKVM